MIGRRAGARTGDFFGGGLSVTWYTTGLLRPDRLLISMLFSFRTPA